MVGHIEGPRPKGDSYTQGYADREAGGWKYLLMRALGADSAENAASAASPQQLWTRGAVPPGKDTHRNSFWPNDRRTNPYLFSNA